VGVGIDETGQNAAPIGIEGFFRLAESLPMLSLITDERDATILTPHDCSRMHGQGSKL
jgi:hypothetical protein